MEVICTALGDDVHDAVAGAAYLRGERSRSNLKFLDRVLRKIGECYAYDFIVIVATVHGDVAAAAKAATELTSSVLVLVGLKVGAGRSPGTR